jgi:hypothetical protein
LHIKTARPLPPIPTTSRQNSVSAQQTAPVEQKTVPTRPLPRPTQTTSDVKTPVLASPEEQAKVEQHIEKASPEQMVQNASHIPSLSHLVTPSVHQQMPPHGSAMVMSDAQQQLQKHHQNNIQLGLLTHQIAEKLPQPERKNFKAIEQLKNTHRNAEFSRQMQFSTVLILPSNVQMTQRMKLAAENQQARLGEAEEILKLTLSQANNDPQKISEASQSHQQQIKEINLRFQAEIVSGDGAVALLEGRPAHNANRVTLANHHLDNNMTIQQQKAELNYATEPLKGQLKDLSSEIHDLEREIRDDGKKIADLEGQIKDVSQTIEGLREDPNMSSLKLKDLILKKDQYEVSLKQALSEVGGETLSTKKERLSTLEGRFKELEQELERTDELITLKEKQLELESKGQNMLMQVNHILSRLA